METRFPLGTIGRLLYGGRGLKMGTIYHKGFKKSYQIDDGIEAENGSYEITDKLGEGGNGVVYGCIGMDGTEYAVKFLLNFSEKSKLRFDQEIDLMQHINHPHIVRYIDNGEANLYDSRQNKSVTAPFLIMEKADTNLLEKIKNNEPIHYSIYAPQFRGLCEALSELHKFAIHRDIKPENILIKGEKWLISDFGLCEYLSEEDHNDITNLNEKIGPIYWMSPEAVNKVYFGADTIGPYSDVFQLCEVFLFFLTRSYPGGMLQENARIDTTPAIKSLLLRSIANDMTVRPQNGKDLLEQFNSATLGIALQEENLVPA